MLNLNLSKEKNSNGNLILDTLAEEEVPTKEEVPIKEEERKYIPPKTKKHLSPLLEKLLKKKILIFQY